jgi:oxygen-dependent protoporphyrinogen oxidase
MPSWLVALGYPRAEVRHNLRGWGIVVPTVERRHVTAVSWVSSKWANRAPADCVLFRVSLGGAGHADAIDVSDDEAITRAHVDISELLGITAEPALSRVYRWRRAIPQFDVGHLERMAAIDRRLERHPGLFLSAAGFRGVGLPDCIGDARQVARRAILHVNGGA